MLDIYFDRTFLSFAMIYNVTTAFFVLEYRPGHFFCILVYCEYVGRLALFLALSKYLFGVASSL